MNPIIEQKTINGNNCVYFTFKDKFTADNAVVAVNELKQNLTEQNKKYTLVWNCRFMTGYEPLARSIWQKIIKE